MEAFARKQMKSNPICYRVSDGAKSKQKKGSFYFYCEDEAGKLEQIFFTASDMKSSQVLAATTHVPRSRAISLCDTAIKGQLTNSGTLDSHMLDTSVSQMANGVSGVVRGFSAKNGLGMEVDYRATCHVNSIGEVSVSLEQK